VEIGETILERVRSCARSTAASSRYSRAVPKSGSSFRTVGWWSFRLPACGRWCSSRPRPDRTSPRAAERDEYVSAFMPCTPNPTTGFFFYVLKRDGHRARALGQDAAQAADERRHDPTRRQSGTAPQARRAGAQSARAERAVRTTRRRSNASGVARPEHMEAGARARERHGRQHCAPGRVAGACGERSGGLAAKARDVLADDLVSVVLFGSAAEGGLRPTSDVNLILSCAASIRRDWGNSAIRARRRPPRSSCGDVPAGERNSRGGRVFAQKSPTSLRRHRVIFGKEVFAATQVPRNAEIFRLAPDPAQSDAAAARGLCVARTARRAASCACSPMRSDRCARPPGTALELEGAPNSGRCRAESRRASFGAGARRRRQFCSPRMRAGRRPNRNGVLVRTIDLVTPHRERAAQLS